MTGSDVSSDNVVLNVNFEERTLQGTALLMSGFL